MSFEQTYGEPIIIPCRVQYVNLVEPETKGEFARNKYCLTMLIPKDDTATMSNILSACADVAGVTDYRQLKKHPFLNQRREFRDGDDPNQNPQLKDKARVGQYFCTIATDKHFDTFIMQDGDFVECHAAEIYDGCYCAVLCTPSQYREGEVTLYLNAVTKVRDGQRLASKVDPMQAMRNWAGVAPSTGETTTEAPLGTSQPSFTTSRPNAQPIATQPIATQPIATQPIATQPIATQPSFDAQLAAGAPMIGQEVTPVATRPKRGRPSNAEKAALTPEVETKPAPGPIPNGRSSLSDIMSK